MKVQDLLAIVGGLMKTLLVVARFLVKPISKLSLNTELVNELFVFEEQRNRRMRKSFAQLSSINSNNFDFERMERNNVKIRDEFNQLKQINIQYNQQMKDENFSPQPKTPYLFDLRDRNNFIKKLPQNDDSITLFSDPNLIYQKENKEVEGTQNKFRGSQSIQSHQSLFKLEAIQQKSLRQQELTKSIQSQSEQHKENSNSSQHQSNSSKHRSNSSQHKTKRKHKSSSCENRFQCLNKQQYEFSNINFNKIRDSREDSIQEQSNQENTYSDQSSIERNKTDVNDSNQICSNNVKIQKQPNFLEKKQQIQMSNFLPKNGSFFSPLKQQRDTIKEDNKDQIKKKKKNIILEQLRLNNFQDSPINLQQDSDDVDQIQSYDYIKQQQQFKDIISQERNSSYQRNGKKQLQDPNSFQFDSSPQFNYQELKKKETPGFGLNESPKNQQVQKLKEEMNLNENFMTVIKNMPKQTFGRQGTKLITNFLQQNYEVHRGKRKATRKQQNEANAMFSNVLEQVQDKPLHFTWFDYIKYYFGKLKCISKKKQIQYSVKKISERLDIVYILQKLVEIDKLKVLLLSYEQQKLFEYMPKPVVCSDPEMKEMQWNRSKSDLLQTWTILNSENGNLDKLTEAFHAYKQIYKKSEKEPLDERLIQMLDPDVKRYFDRTHVDVSQLSTPHKQSPSSTHFQRTQQKRSSSFKPTKIEVNLEIQEQHQPKQTQENIRLRRSSSYQDRVQTEVSEKGKFLSSCTTLKMQRGLSDQTRKWHHKSLNIDKNVLHHQLNIRNIDQSQLNSRSTLSNKKNSNQYWDNQNNRVPNDLQLYKKMSYEQNYNVGDDSEGQISYPRPSIHVNSKEQINQTRELFDNIERENQNSYGRNRQFNIMDTQFSFCKKSLESPNTNIDQGRKSNINNYNMGGKLSLITKLQSTESIQHFEDRSNNQNKQHCSPYRNLSPDKNSSQYKNSPNKKSQFQRQQSSSHHDFDSVNENNPHNNQIFFNSKSYNRNYSFGNQFSHDTSQSNIGKMENSSFQRQTTILTQSCQENAQADQEEIPQQCQNTTNYKQIYSYAPKHVSIFYNKPTQYQGQEFQQQILLKQNSANQDEINTLPQIYRVTSNNYEQQQMNVINNQQYTNQQEDNNKQYLDPNKLNESLRNKNGQMPTSFSSFQTIPEENIKQKREDIKFQNIHSNKFEDEKEFKLRNYSSPSLKEYEQIGNNDNFLTSPYRKTIPTLYSQLSPNRENIPINERKQFPINVSDAKQNIINNKKSNSKTQSPIQEKLLFNNYGIGSQNFFNNPSPESLKNSQKIEQLQQQIQEKYISQNMLQNEVNINKNSERNNINPNQSINKQSQNNYNNTDQRQQSINYNPESLIPSNKKQSSKYLPYNQQKSSFYNNHLSPNQKIDNTENGQIIIDNQIRSPHIHKQSSNNTNIPSSSDVSQIPNKITKTNSNKSNNLNQNNGKNSLNLKLNIGQSGLEMAKSPQIQNLINQQSNTKQFESPYTRQQKFLKKKQQEQQTQVFNKDSYSQGQNNYVNPSTLSAYNTNRKNEPNKQGNIFNFENIKALDNSSFNSFYKSDHKSIVTPNQKNMQKNSSYLTRERVDTKFSNNDNLLIISEADEQKNFIIQEKKESTSEELIKEKKILNIQLKIQNNTEPNDSSENNSKGKNEKQIIDTLYNIETSPMHLLNNFEQDHFQTITSDSDEIIDLNNETKKDKNEQTNNQNQKYKSKSRNASIILFNDNAYGKNSNEENSS